MSQFCQNEKRNAPSHGLVVRVKAKSLLLWGSNSKKKLGFGYKGLVFCRNNGWIVENQNGCL